MATWRPDLLERHGLRLSNTFDEVLDLARNGYVTASMFPLDALMYSYSFCEALGGEAFKDEERFAPPQVLAEALGYLKELAELCPGECLVRNPIRTAEFMSQSDEPSASYNPFAYGYSNYSRPGYARYPLKAGGVVSLNGRPLRTVLVGAGLAVSARSRHVEVAVDYSRFTASPEIQRGLYYESGGQPGHRSAWTDTNINGGCANFFADTLDTLDSALLRPSHPGYVYFQDKATPVMGRFLAGDLELPAAIKEFDRLYRESLTR